MKQRLCFMVLLLLLGSTVYCQHKKKKTKKEHQIYLGASINRAVPSRVSEYNTPSMRLTQITPYSQINLGFNYQKVTENNWFQEFSLSKLSLVREEFKTFYDDGFIKTTKRRKYSVFDIVGRYEYGKYFGRQKKGKFNFGLSAGVEPYYSYYKPLYHEVYLSESHIVGFNFQLIPIVSYSISERVVLEFKLLSQLLNLYAHKTRTNDPFLLESQQRTLTAGATAFSKNLAFSLTTKYRISDDTSNKKKKKKKRRRR